MARWIDAQKRFKQIFLDTSIKKLVCRYGEIAVSVASGDAKTLMKTPDLAVVAVRVGNLLILCSPEIPPLSVPMAEGDVSETMCVPESEVEVFYWGEDGCFYHAIDAHHKTVQIGELLVRVVQAQSARAEFIRCAFY